MGGVIKDNTGTLNVVLLRVQLRRELISLVPSRTRVLELQRLYAVKSHTSTF
jgi:hypothetical protein